MDKQTEPAAESTADLVGKEKTLLDIARTSLTFLPKLWLAIFVITLGATCLFLLTYIQNQKAQISKLQNQNSLAELSQSVAALGDQVEALSPKIGRLEQAIADLKRHHEQELGNSRRALDNVHDKTRNINEIST